ncbi:uncharacterized protein TRAVEDRAFT_111073 [Trametes versicolor FP-101664 SS1]|uniref:uncharacterized protein n=1 Tax=Trametes versicolor (strain FP-101664) TaxID=717944 RepID=UPI00046248BA|nr:uncharacterized protein TRAVEDRAFT_111073 [Trametes versicolor FP-101664 SS1]EIW65151.1 hypothetical protein TRAVEDRAFT_111073 [Trametes versicolor FP-101664 SS1]
MQCTHCIQAMLQDPDLAPGTSIKQWILGILMFHFNFVHGLVLVMSQPRTATSSRIGLMSMGSFTTAQVVPSCMHTMASGLAAPSALQLPATTLYSPWTSQKQLTCFPNQILDP